MFLALPFRALYLFSFPLGWFPPGSDQYLLLGSTHELKRPPSRSRRPVNFVGRYAGARRATDAFLSEGRRVRFELQMSPLLSCSGNRAPVKCGRPVCALWGQLTTRFPAPQQRVAASPTSDVVVVVAHPLPRAAFWEVYPHSGGRRSPPRPIGHLPTRTLH